MNHYIIAVIFICLLLFWYIAKKRTKKSKYPTFGNYLININAQQLNKTKKVRCSKCGIKMYLVQGLMSRSAMDEAKGCYKCEACSRFTCFECSDSRIPCKCGKIQWEEHMYLESNANEK